MFPLHTANFGRSAGGPPAGSAAVSPAVPVLLALFFNFTFLTFNGGAQTTSVLFPVSSLFGGAAYNRPITITAANTLISDGQNLWAGTYTIIPASTTNPIVSLYPNTYLLTVAGVVRPARLVVPPSTNVLNAAALITSGPLFYFGTNGFANLLAGTNLLLVTNADGSLTLNSLAGGGTGGLASNVYFASGTNTYFDTLNGSNRFSVPSTAFDAPGAAAAVTNGYLWGSLYEVAGAAQKATNLLGSAAFKAAGAFDPAGAAAAVLVVAVTNGATPDLNGANLTNTPLALGTAVTGSNGAAAVWMVGLDASGKATSNAVPVSTGSTSSNNFAGSLNLAQVYGLGTAAGLSSNSILGMAGAAVAASNYLTALPGCVVTNNQANVVLGGATFTLTNAGGTSATLNLGATPGVSQSLQASPAGLVAAGVLLNNGTLTATALNLNNGGSITGNGANLTNTPGSITAAGANVTVTPATNAATGQITYSVAANGGGSSGSATNAINPNGGTGTNINLTRITTVDQPPVLFATPTYGVFYGDSITMGNYVTNGYVADLANLGWQHFIAVNNGISSAHLSDVSNYFYGNTYSGTLCYTNWLGKPGTNAWVSFWVGIDDCLFDASPLDTNTWINAYTNLWWTAHTNGASPVVVCLIEDSLQLSAAGETNRLLLNSLIAQNAASDSAWLLLLDTTLILPATNTTYFLYNSNANYGLHPTDYGHALVAQALASQLMLQTNLSRGAYFNGPVWSTTGFGGIGSNLCNLSAAKIVGVLAPTNVPVNTVVNVGSGLTVASNSAAGVQTYTVGVGSISAAPPFLSQRVWAYLPSGSGTTWNGFGQTATTSGTFSSLAETATDPYAILLSTTASAGNYTSVGDNQKTITAAKPLLLAWRAGLTNSANVRVWLAVSDYATIAAGDVSRNAMGFLYSSTNSGDWKFVTQYGGAYVWTDTGMAADTNSHSFELYYDGSANAYGYIDNVCVATNTSDLLVSYQWAAWATVTALTNSPVGLRFVQFYGQQGF